MSELVALSREAILQADDIEIRKVEIPEWGGYVYVRGMTGKERDDYEASLVKQRGRDTQVNMRNARAKLVVLCAVDEQGNKLFSESDIAKISRKSAKAIDRIFAVARELSGITEDDMEELTENFDETDTDD